MDAEELTRRRQQLGLNKSELARALDVSVQTIRRWEAGTLAIQHGVILGLALDMLEHDQGERNGKSAADDDR